MLLWGFTAILGVLINIPPVDLVFYRTFLSALFLVVIIKVRGTGFNLGYQAMGYLLLAGVLVASHWITFFWSARVANVSVSLAGFATVALWTSILEPILLQ